MVTDVEAWLASIANEAFLLSVSKDLLFQAGAPQYVVDGGRRLASAGQGRGLFAGPIAIQAADLEWSIALAVRCDFALQSVSWRGKPLKGGHYLGLCRKLGAVSTTSQSAILDMLGLSPMEAKLVMVLQQTYDVRKSSEIMGWTLSTARTSLKTIFLKLQISKQTELLAISQLLELYCHLENKDLAL